jgi:hypothetical protein
VDHGHLSHAIQPITVESFGEPNRDQRTASIRRNLDDLTRIRLAVVLLTLETETNLDASELGHLLFLLGSFYIGILPNKNERVNLQYRKVRVSKYHAKKNISFAAQDLLCAILADSLAQDLQCLPFWQKPRPFCHFGSQPPLRGRVRCFPTIVGVNPP